MCDNEIFLRSIEHTVQQQARMYPLSSLIEIAKINGMKISIQKNCNLLLCGDVRGRGSVVKINQY